MKIIVAGIGGVGGYFGGLLAKEFAESNEVEIHFLARGENLKQIKKHGLKVIKGNSEFIAKPRSATDNSGEIGIADYIILCTKSYDLENTVEQLKPCIDKNTVLLPLLNGVDSAEKIKNILPGVTVFNGCVYIISSLKEPGTVENSGNIQTLYFGLENETTEKLLQLENIFKQANIDATLTWNITSVVWGKFLFVGANSTATSYFNCSKGEILADKTKYDFFISLLTEINQIALTMGISFDREMVSATLDKIRALPYESTSSMHRDFQKSNSRTELETITGYVVRAGQMLSVPTPIFLTAYNGLQKKDNHQ